MSPSIHLTPALEQNAVAREIRRRILRNLERTERLNAFLKMWGTVVLVFRPEASPVPGIPSDGVSTLTLRFDYGTLTIHEGRVGRPDLTLWGSAATIFALSGRRALLPDVGLEVFGRGTHPRFAYRFGSLLDAS